MSYIIYLNGQKLRGSQSFNLAQTKQVNDIASLTNRNSNYTLPVKVDRNAENDLIFNNAFKVGNQSNTAYTKAQCDVIDADTGLHFIYKGYAVLTESSPKEYSITIYDGIIDFYKAIENLTITEIGVTELNHIKNIANVVETWNDTTLPYRYILADYNGNNYNVLLQPNIDFQVPSALCEYIWNRIFSYIGFTFSGSIFQHEKFKNLWLTYPKPVPTEEPITEPVTEQDSLIITNDTSIPYNGGTFYGTTSYVEFLPTSSAVDPAYLGLLSGAVNDGLFRISFSAGSFTLNTSSGNIVSTRIRVQVVDALNQPVSTNFVDITEANFIDVFLHAGDRVFLTLVRMDVNYPLTASSSPAATTILTGDPITTTIEVITGYTLGFDQAFIDYKVSDFIKEILIEFGLTPYKDKFTNTIKFMTLYELLQNQSVSDWSDKFIGKSGEKYTFGNYAKRNIFKPKYNDDGMTHNNGYIEVNNENLPDEITLHQSNIYSPNRIKSAFLTSSNVYPIWSKEVKDDATIEYKDLDGRFYFMRAEKVYTPMTVCSVILGGTVENSFYYRESYYRLSYSNVVDDWYRPIKSIFDKAKLVVNQFWLTKKDIYNIDLSKLIVVKQLSSYFLINKISNFTPGKITNVECIEVDYFKETDIIVPEPIDYTAYIGVPTIADCQVTLPVTTNYPLPVQCELVVYSGGYDSLANLVFNQMTILPVPSAELAGGTISFPISQLPYNALGYKFALRILTADAFSPVLSAQTEVVVLDGSCYDPIVVTTAVIDSVEIINEDTYTKTYRINFTSDAVLPSQVDYKYYTPPSGIFGGWEGYFPILAAVNHIDVTLGTMFGSPTKFKIKIGTIESDDFPI